MSLGVLARYLNIRTLLLVLFYIGVCGASYWLAYELRFDFNVPEHFAAERIVTIWWVVLLQLAFLTASGQVDCILSYFRLPDAIRLFGALFIAAAILAVMWYLYGGDEVPPRAVILTDLLLCFVVIGTFRVAIRLKSSRGLEDWFAGKEAEHVIIVGAGEVGAGLCSELLNKTRLGMRPVAFLDDDPKKIGRYVHGILVADTVEALPKVAKRTSASKAVIAFPSASVKRVRTVADIAREAGLAVDIVPALTDLVSGRAEMTQLRPVQLEDLLGRDPVDLDSEEIRGMLSGARVLVTGAGGSIGAELMSQILDYGPTAVCGVDQAETAIFQLRQDLQGSLPEGLVFETRILDIRDARSMERLFGGFRPDIVFHAAAHKHVELMEWQPAEALRNNFFATVHLCELASAHAVDRFVLISTDKAINPTSVMGASKRLAELATQVQQGAAAGHTKFMAVRFGNVLGSSGSVIPIFRRQIAAGGPLTVTDPEVTRYFMTVEEAVGLVLQSASQGDGGEIFVLDMGEPVKILDIARQMIALSGLREGEDIEIEFSGLKPGEKRFEELQHLSESLNATDHPRILRFISEPPQCERWSGLLSSLRACLDAQDESGYKETIRQQLPEYTPWVRA